MERGNLFANVPDCLPDERFETLLVGSGFRLERIISTGQATPEGQWYDQDGSEWVLLLKGAAGLRIEGTAAVTILNPGDYVYLPAHLKHRVEWTDPNTETVWLALHQVDGK
jgi:cupin 2 domain-containing protein